MFIIIQCGFIIFVYYIAKNEKQRFRILIFHSLEIFFNSYRIPCIILSITLLRETIRIPKTITKMEIEANTVLAPSCFT